MARAHPHTLRPLATPDQPALNRQLRRFLARELVRLQPRVASSAAACGAERYRKHFDSYAHLCLLLFHGLSGSPSLRHSYAAFSTCPGLVGLSGLGTADPDRLAVSFSQFAASNTSRPAACLAPLVRHLAGRVRQAGARPRGGLPADLRVLDATFLRLSVQLAPWLPAASKHEGSGLRLQVVYSPAVDLPEHVLLTDHRTNDVRGWDHLLLDDPTRLATLHDQTLVLDLGYYSHARLHRLRQAGVHFVSRLHAQARVTVTAVRPIQLGLPARPDLPTGRITVLADADITLGSPNNRAGAVLGGLRRVVASVQPGPRAARRGAQPITYEVVTDRVDLAADEVVQLYLWRWEIELFFRWLKRTLGLVRLLGYSRNAVELSVWLALLVHLLCVLAAQTVGWARRAPTLLARVRWLLAHVSVHDLPRLADDLPAPHTAALPGLAAAPT